MANAKIQQFTLLEMVLAVTIFAMVAMTVGMALFGLHRTWEKTQKHSTDLQTLQRIERVADTAFRNMIPFKWIDNNMKESFVFAGDSDRLTFAYLHRINVVEAGGIRFLTLRLDGDKLMAEYRDTPLLPWQTDTTNVRREILSTKVKRLAFSYADHQATDLVWLDDWDEEQSLNLPLAVLMTVEWQNGNRESWLRRTAGSGLHQSLGIRRQLQIQATQQP